MNTKNVSSVKLLKLLNFSFLFLTIPVSMLYGQVTIGSNEAPIDGALLQLKDIAEATPGGVNATKGLCMPRMILKKQFDFSDIIAEPTATDRNNHIGLCVYQVGYQNNEDGIFCPGLYVWDGNQWMPLMDISGIYDKSGYDADREILYDSEGNDYHTADFGDAGRWMTQNLRTKTIGLCGKVDLAEIGAQLEWIQPRYLYPCTGPGSNDSHVEWVEQWGYLYNWAAATANKGGGDGRKSFGNEADSGAGNTDVTVPRQGICPKGWHLPSDKEWNDLEEELNLNPDKYTQTPGSISVWNDAWRTVTGAASRGGYGGKYMKSKTPINGYATAGYSKPYNGTEKGFDALALGDAERNTGNISFGKYGFFWTSSASGTDEAWGRQFEADGISSVATDRIERTSAPRYYMYSVRCKQDGTGKAR